MPGRSSTFHLEDGEKRFLRNLDGTDLLHALLAGLLLLQQFLLPRVVATVALREHVLAQRFYRLARDDIRSDRRLNRYIEHLSRNKLAHLDCQFTPAVARMVAMHD